MTITIEITSEDLERLREGVAQFGRCALVVQTSEGVPVYLAASSNHKGPGRPRKTAKAEAHHESGAGA